MAGEIDTLFANPFKMEDLQVFDDKTWRELMEAESVGLKLSDIALGLRGVSGDLVRWVLGNAPKGRAQHIKRLLARDASDAEVEAARRRVLDKLFWELTYWKAPTLYEELTDGEALHPGIFRGLRERLEGRVVLDAGAGSGRSTFECLHAGAEQVIAVEPSGGLRNILKSKVVREANANGKVKMLPGRFDKLPVGDRSVDVALSCSAFTAEEGQGGEAGLDELSRVTRPGGTIVIVWPRRSDVGWLQERGFEHVSIPVHEEMMVRFHSMDAAQRCANLFYRKNPAVSAYIEDHGRPEVPYSVLGFEPPHDYCWREAA